MEARQIHGQSDGNGPSSSGSKGVDPGPNSPPTPGQIASQSDDQRGSSYGKDHSQEHGVHGRSDGDSGRLATPSEIAQLTPPGSFLEREKERDKAREEGNADNGGYARARERSLADEQREEERGRGR